MGCEENLVDEEPSMNGSLDSEVLFLMTGPGAVFPRPATHPGEVLLYERQTRRFVGVRPVPWRKFLLWSVSRIIAKKSEP
jgi:hypothetical protein